jgi:hypothetical protein
LPGKQKWKSTVANLNFWGWRLYVNGSWLTTLVQQATRTATADEQNNDQQKNRYPYDGTDDDAKATKLITDFIKFDFEILKSYLVSRNSSVPQHRWPTMSV